MIIEYEQLHMIRDVAPGVSIGYTSGVFDLLHAGHINYLTQCKRHCDVLVVGVDSNRWAKQRKGRLRPVQDFYLRAMNVSKYADYVFAKNEASARYTQILCPEFYFFSTDNIVLQNKQESISNALNYKAAVLIPYTAGISTTEILRGPAISN